MTLRATLSLGVLFFLTAAAAEASQLQNGDFDSPTPGSTAGWDVVSGNNGTEDWANGSATHSTLSDSNYGMALRGWLVGGGIFYQDVPAVPGYSYTLTAELHLEPGFNPDTFFDMKLEWFNGVTPISQEIFDILGAGLSTGSDATDSAEWHDIAVSGVAPAGTTTVRSTFIWQNTSDVGGLQAARVDNAALGVIPEPSSFALLGIGLAGLAGLSRRRRRR